LAQLLLMLLAVTHAARADAQIVESVGSRALGMGGAFVAVANDSSASWWNPGALADGPFIDLAVAGSITDTSELTPASRDRASWVTLGTPPFGISYYRLRITEIDNVSSTAPPDASREDGLGTVPVRSLNSHHVGVTLVHSIVTGVHAGATVRYIRGSVSVGAGDASRSTTDLLEWGADLESGTSIQRFDVDVGALAVFGAFRAGALFRNLFEPEFDAPAGPPVRLPRQVRVGGAFDGDAIDRLPLTLSIDADLLGYATAAGERRVVAFGAEQWLLKKRLGLRAGGRFNTVGAKDRAATGGVSVGLLPSVFVDGHVVRGGTADDRGWGIAARVSF
jgi:hypothetical protein